MTVFKLFTEIYALGVLLRDLLFGIRRMISFKILLPSLRALVNLFNRGRFNINNLYSQVVYTRFGNARFLRFHTRVLN